MLADKRDNAEVGPVDTIPSRERVCVHHNSQDHNHYKVKSDTMDDDNVVNDASIGGPSSQQQSSSLSSSVPAPSYQSTIHARLRRKQRCIDKKDLKAAIKYGKCEPHYFGKRRGRRRGIKTHLVKYTYQDIVYIVDQQKWQEVTCYARPIALEKVATTRDMRMQHENAVRQIQTDPDCWTSHTVIVVDTSGSMRTSDMWGTRNRLKSVWFSIAIDYLVERLEHGHASITDVITIVEMGETPRFVCHQAPTTWTLYNQIVECYQSSSFPPRGHGNFLPSLSVAEELLNQNSNAACAAALIFLSDGAPSDRGPMRKELIVEKVESIAQAFGRRLTFTAIGIGDRDDFSMLQDMVEAAKDYGATAEFKLPSMTSSSLGKTFSSTSSSLTKSQMEMTDLGTLKQRKVRDVVRESKSKASEHLTEINDDFWVYSIDEVKRKIYKERVDSYGTKEVYYETVPLQHPDARFVAMSKGPFGEGAERFAHRFYEVAADEKTIVGRALVAKESRMVLDTVNDETEIEARKQFVRTFIETQQIARRLAVKFNDKLQASPRVHERTPRVSFLDCSIYELDDVEAGILTVLVEEKLDYRKWQKWNSNNGIVDGMDRRRCCIIISMDQIKLDII